jgi:hypothetical protein
MDQFVKLLKANPGPLSYASSGTCGIGHRMRKLFKATSGTFMVHIPYRGLWSADDRPACRTEPASCSRGADDDRRPWAPVVISRGNARVD